MKQFFYLISFGQTVVVSTTEDIVDPDEDPVYDIVVTEPIGDTIDIRTNKVYTVVIEYNGQPSSFYRLDQPMETYADINNLERPDKDYELWTDQERDNFGLIIEKTNILKFIELPNKTILEFEVISDRITHSEFYLNNKLIKTFYFLKE